MEEIAAGVSSLRWTRWRRGFAPALTLCSAWPELPSRSPCHPLSPLWTSPSSDHDSPGWRRSSGRRWYLWNLARPPGEFGTFLSVGRCLTWPSSTKSRIPVFAACKPRSSCRAGTRIAPPGSSGSCWQRTASPLKLNQIKNVFKMSKKHIFRKMLGLPKTDSEDVAAMSRPSQSTIDCCRLFSFCRLCWRLTFVRADRWKISLQNI